MQMNFFKVLQEGKLDGTWICQKNLVWEDEHDHNFPNLMFVIKYLLSFISYLTVTSPILLNNKNNMIKEYDKM